MLKVHICLGRTVHIIFNRAGASILQVHTNPLSKAEVSREYREEKKKKNKGVPEKRQISELAQDRK